MNDVEPLARPMTEAQLVDRIQDHDPRLEIAPELLEAFLDARPL